MKEIKIGIIGAGANTRLHHLPKFQAIEGVRVEVVCNRSPESSQIVADAFGVPRIATRWEDIIEDSSLDAVCIGTWPYLHSEVSIAALQSGKHVLTEARMAMNAEQAMQMLEVSQANPGLVAQIVPSPLSFKWDRTVAAILDSGELGSLREVEFVKSLSANADSDAPINWRQNIEYSGNNTMMLGIYYEVVQRWLKREPISVLAIGDTFTQKRMNPETGEFCEVSIPETLDVHAKYPDGLRLVGRMTGLDYGANRDSFFINGSEGSLRLDLIDGKLYKTLKGKGEELVYVSPELESTWNVEVDFIDSIRSNKDVNLTGFPDGVRYMKFTDAVLSSVQQNGAWISL